MKILDDLKDDERKQAGASLKAGYWIGLCLLVIGALTLLVSPYGWAVMALAPLAATWETVRTWNEKEREGGNGDD
jgi:hypothetical protein